MFALKHSPIAQRIPQSSARQQAVPSVLGRPQHSLPICRASKKDDIAGVEPSRRELFGAGGALLLATATYTSPAFAEGNLPKTEKANDEYAIFYGYATPPTSYGACACSALADAANQEKGMSQ